MPAVRRCCIVDCDSNSADDTSLHFFHLRKPGDKTYYKWKQALRSSMWSIQTVKNPLICSVHFTADSMNGRRLKADAVPSLRLSETPEPSEASSMTGDYDDTDTETETEIESNSDYRIDYDGGHTETEMDVDEQRPMPSRYRPKEPIVRQPPIYQPKSQPRAQPRAQPQPPTFSEPYQTPQPSYSDYGDSDDYERESKEIQEHKRRIMDSVVYEWFVRANLSPQIAGHMNKAMIIEVAENAKELIGVSHVEVNDDWMTKFRDEYLKDFIRRLNDDELQPISNSLYLPEIIEDVVRRYITKNAGRCLRTESEAMDEEDLSYEINSQSDCGGVGDFEPERREVNTYAEVVTQLRPLKTYAFYTKRSAEALDLIYDVENALR